MSKGKGGVTENKTEIDPALQAAGEDNLALAKKVGQIGYMPYRGASVAALTPSQEASRKNTASAADAFGMAGSGIGAGAGLPPVSSAGGARGYSSAPVLDDAISKIPPGQLQALLSLFMNPNTGKMSGAGAQAPQPAARKSLIGKGGSGQSTQMAPASAGKGGL